MSLCVTFAFTNNILEFIADVHVELIEAIKGIIKMEMWLFITHAIPKYYCYQKKIYILKIHNTEYVIDINIGGISEIVYHVVESRFNSSFAINQKGKSLDPSWEM